ncbi:MAG: hypothetical protein K6G48_04915, partial [Acholeplasmatales bacterium]|nr:hypothetical protein [Acholeplasmatales bacterium]
GTTSGELSGNVSNGSSTGALDAGDGVVLKQGAVQITSCSGEEESAYVEFKPYSGATSYNVYLKGANDTEYQLLDYEDVYVQSLSSNTVRADLFGLPAGDYSIQVKPVTASGEVDNPAQMTVSVVAYDRSGYAHFNYSAGVGAYNDDGSLKDDAIVVYVTDANKDTVMEEVCARYEALDMFQVPSTYENDHAGEDADSIGWWLNNTQFSKAERDSKGEIIAPQSGKKTSDTYSADGATLGFKQLGTEHPIVIRFAGEVTAPEGLTVYDSYKQGGSEGDNGNMARMKDYINVTLEGVGNDAVIEGWGFHFICSDTTNTYGKSFEVRNLCFDKYTEDAVGMEGVQDGSTITASVERCWVHNNTFLPGYCANPAESDKAEGDGSCDFKRGQYYTMSYNYYEYCHKTNLVGSSDSSLQYNISFHHNTWYNCGSRIPLLRQSNLHFYNNYVYGDSSDNNAALSYVSSLRASCYMYAENNYYEGCKNPFQKKDGAAKLYGNTMVGCFEDNDATTVSSRTEAVSSSCAYNGTSYANFDTNSSLFYYNESTQQSDCYLTTAAVARQEDVKYSGSRYRTVLDKTSFSIESTSNKYSVDETNSIDLSSGTYTATLSSDQGIVYNGVKSGKFKGQGITFRLTNPAIVTVAMTASSGYAAGYLVSSTGELMLAGSGTVQLDAGVYYITSCIIDKETTVTSLVFEKYDSAEYDAQKISEYNALVAAIPSTIAYNASTYEAIKAAMNAYTNLGDLQSSVDYTAVEAAYNSYKALGEDYVEGLINQIGTVTSDSGDAISSARAAYTALIASCSDATVSNLATLEAAESAYYSLAVDALIAKIDTIGTVTLDSESLIVTCENMYSQLDDSQKASVTNYSTLTAARATLNSLIAVNEVESALADIDTSTATVSELAAVVADYDALTATEQASVTQTTKLEEVYVAYFKGLVASLPSTITTSDGETITTALDIYSRLTDADKTAVADDYATLEAANTAYTEILNARQVVTFEDGAAGNNSYFTITANLKSGIASKTYDGVTYTAAIKMESKTSITFTAASDVTVTIITDSASKDIKINGTSYTADANGVVTAAISAGAVSITKDDSLNIYAIIVE